MTKGNLYLNMIVKWSESKEMVKRSIDSVKPFVDGMYITITYNENKEQATALKTFLESYGVVVSVFKWIDDFSAARNFAMEQVPFGSDKYIYWHDADDILQKADQLPLVFDSVIENNWSCVGFDYWYHVDLDDKGKVKNVIIKQKRERILRNDGTFKWKGWLHETPVDIKSINVDKVFSKDCLVVHLSTEERSEDSLLRNMRILRAQAEAENHSDPRTLVYLAKAYFDRGVMFPEEQKDSFDEALILFDEYLNGKGTPGSKDYRAGSGWIEERANALGFVSRIYEILGEFEQALKAIDQAITIAPQFPNYLVDKAAIYVNMGDFKKGKTWLTLASALDMPETTIIESPTDMLVRAMETDLHLALNLDMDLGRAQEDIYKLMELMPRQKEILQQRLIEISSINEGEKAAKHIVSLGKYLEQIKETDKMPALINAVPDALRREKFYAEMKHLFVPPRIWDNNEIAIFCGPGVQQWSPKTLVEGLGGSEEAVVYLSKELVKLGWKVTVYANPEADAGEYDGVNYLPYYDFNVSDIFNVLVLWRSIGFVDFNLSAKYKLVWLHDVPNNPDFTQERVNKIDKIAVLSDFHKSLLRMNIGSGNFGVIPDNKILVTRNGIPNLDIAGWKGNPKKIVYISSLDRGLIYLLLKWDDIKKEVPDAELHVYYGFDVYDKLFRNNPARMKWKKMILDMMAKPGITYHGKLGHEALHKEISSAGIWAYPTDFDEISCISAMKAQALGAVPVVTNFAALQETVKNGIKVDVDITTDEGKDEYFKALIDMLQHPEKQEELRPEMMKFAADYFQWSRVAKQWSEEFKKNDMSEVLTPEEFIKVKK